MESVNLKLEKGLLQKIDSSLAEYHFSTRTEFIRTAIRDKLTKLEKEKALKRLGELRGSLKGKAKMGDEEAGDLAAKKIAAKFGIDLD